MTTQIILASASPRRKELLDQINVTYSVYPVDIDETPHLNEAPLEYVLRMANEKSLACIERLGREIPVLSADTIVVLGTRILGKPKDQDDAIAMLTQLSGKTHQVFSAVSLRGREDHQAVSMTEVTFRPLSQSEILSYWLSGEPRDKAGSYGIQGLGGLFAESIKGSFTGVVGLPLFETAELLLKQGIKIFK